MLQNIRSCLAFLQVGKVLLQCDCKPRPIVYMIGQCCALYNNSVDSVNRQCINCKYCVSKCANSLLTQAGPSLQPGLN